MTGCTKNALPPFIHQPPLRQIEIFLAWFLMIGVETFDLQLRVPTRRPLAPGREPWVWLTRRHQGIRAQQVLHLRSWLRHMNAHGADVFFRPHRSGAHPVLFLDDLPLAKARMVAAKYGAAVVCTSPDNTQLWLRTDRPLSREERGIAQRHLSALGYSDPGSVSGDHLGRLCGLVSQKRHC